MYKLAIIGCGNIARFHLPAMQACGFSISAISGRPGSSEYLKKFASDFRLSDVEIYSNPVNLINSGTWDAILLSCPTDVMMDYLEITTKKCKPILAEKPVSNEPEKLKKFFKNKYIKVAYNRRFYKTTKYAKDFLLEHKNSIVKVTIPESSDELFNTKFFPKRLPINSYENSVHVIDLVRFILGDIKWSYHESIKKTANYRALIGVGKSEMGNSVILDSCFNSSDNFSIQFIHDTKRLELKPLESAQLYDGMRVIHPTRDIPVRTYKPLLKEQLIETDADNIKLGFRLQAEDFKNFCDGKKSFGATIHDSYKALKTIEGLK